MKLNKSSSTQLIERNLLTRFKIINAFKLGEEQFLKKHFCDRETLFSICLPYFKKIPRENTDVKFISLYLSKIKNFTNLIEKRKEENNTKYNNNESKYLKLLKYLSENIIYENYPPNKLLMRYGEKGDKFYIILEGLISIIVPVKVNKQLTFKEFNRYIALLLFYKEFELAKLVIYENNPVYNVDLPDMRSIIQYFNRNNEEKEPRNSDIKKHIRKKKSEKLLFNKQTENKYLKNLSQKNIEQNIYLKEDEIIQKENNAKLEKFMAKYLNREELLIFKKIKNGENYEIDNDVTPQQYIDRINISFVNGILKITGKHNWQR